MSLRFRLADLQRELHALDAIAKRYLAPRSRECLAELAESLERIHRSGRGGEWLIPRDEPLETGWSPGAYAAGGHGAHHVYAQLSMVWDVRPVDRFHIEVFDRASIEVKLISDDVLGVMHMDMGDADAPGCFFHVQVHNDGQAGPGEAFPSSLDVPRFPTLIATPASVLEFVLSELFQSDWRRHASGHGQRGVWLGAQRKWWQRHLEWQRGIVNGAEFSPWVELKESQPGAGLFC